MYSYNDNDNDTYYCYYHYYAYIGLLFAKRQAWIAARPAIAKTPASAPARGWRAPARFGIVCELTNITIIIIIIIIFIIMIITITITITIIDNLSNSNNKYD